MTTRDEQSAHGRTLRAVVPRSAHGEFRLPDDRDPIAIIRQQDASRIAHLVPVRHSRMAQTPFAYFRGTAAAMAADLTASARTDIRVLISGDAHISNFGLYASPERRLLFDLNDFDEAGYGPWEWDVKRLVSSVVVSAQDNGFRGDQARDAAYLTAMAYRLRLRELAALSPIERYFASADTEWLGQIAPKPLTRLIRETANKARKRTSARMIEKITAVSEDGVLRIVDDPPLLVRPPEQSAEKMSEFFDQYRRSLRADLRTLLAQYRVADVALRVVGVGSVGTRCYIMLLQANDGSGVFLQVKQAQQSVLAVFGGLSDVAPTTAPQAGAGREAFRVVSAQQTLQAQADPLLGWMPTVNGRDYYFRQFRDMKGSVATDQLNLDQFEAYCGACAALLARAHAQSPQSPVIASYLGKSDPFDRAVTSWSVQYASQIAQDYDALTNAISAGLVSAAEESQPLTSS